jgi:hypothetical protein
LSRFVPEPLIHRLLRPKKGRPKKGEAKERGHLPIRHLQGGAQLDLTGRPSGREPDFSRRCDFGGRGDFGGRWNESDAAESAVDRANQTPEDEEENLVATSHQPPETQRAHAKRTLFESLAD